MPTFHDFNAALPGKLDDQQQTQARGHLLQIGDAANEVLARVRCEPTNELCARDIAAIGALIAHWGTQLAILVDGEQRLAAQYINRLAELLREQSKAADPPAR